MEADLNAVCARVFSRFMDEGPSGDGNSVSAMAVAEEEILNLLQAGGWGPTER